MIAWCKVCETYFDDYDRDTLCPHDQFAANDGHNNFSMRPDSYIGKELPVQRAIGYIPIYPVGEAKS